ncbi:MAG TPA: glycosyltransferase [Levilinea sp.]|nr:glycosyltransferase [Levilinea sp.]
MAHQPDQARIVFLFSDTGGGHRSAASAIIEALELEFSGQVACEMIDIFRQYAPPPLHMAPEIYPPLSRMPEVWELGYKVSNSSRRMRVFYNAIWPYVRAGVNRLVRENPADLIVSVHSLVNAPVLRVLRNQQTHIPFITVVTDMVSTHAAWYDTRADLIIVPTEAACQRGLQMGLLPEQIRVVGLPVADRFCREPGNRQALRQQLGWPQHLPVILLVGGGDGMGPLEDVASAINHSGLHAALIVIAGRNKQLKTRLEKNDWNIPAIIYGFVQEMPDFMRAADVLVTKAGPGTISEAFIANLPIILFSRLPGQEEGNVTYVTDEGAGAWAPEPGLVVETLRRWLAEPAQLRQVSEACSRLARPHAAREIAHILASKAIRN